MTMRRSSFLAAFAATILAAVVLPALAQTDNVTLGMPGSSRAYSVADAIPAKDGVKRLVVLKGLDKITGRAVNIYAPIGIPVKYASLTITARYCYSTPQIETPETTAFIQIVDDRPDQPERKAFSGWMLASSPSLNGMQHPIYDVWVISCMTNQAGQVAPAVASTAPVKVASPDAGAKDALPTLPEGAGQ
jgi:hypothetical protein